MSSRKWNEHQRRVIDLRGQSVVVSAAAGSGKTSVLTERVLRLIEEGEDLSRMLIVTFTNLAAGEMRGRIYQRLQEAGRDNPRLAAQAEKCTFADISTLHAFCGRLIRDNFAQAGISPTFTIADETEMARLRQDALDSVIEEALANGAQRRIVLKYAGRGDMQALKSIVMTIYNRAISLKDPAGWLAEARVHFDGGAFVETLFTEYRSMVKEAASTAAAYLNQRTALWRESGFEAEALRSEAERKTLLRGATEMTSRAAYLPEVSVISVDAKGAPNRGSKSMTTSANKCLEELRRWEGDFAAKAIKELSRTADDGRFFIDLTRAFMNRYAKAKRAKNLLDHDDTMHLAIKVLKAPDIAARYQDKYGHVFVDEYQDINEAQHAIISALQRGNNDFLVGDVKQCIYMFRESNPELLLRRCRELSGTGLIEMNTNYRSVPAVIDFINDVMGQMMTEEAGGVSYTGGQRLSPGAQGDGRVDIVLAGRAGEDGEDTLDSVEAEAAQLAGLIDGFVAEGFAYGDIAVLRPELSGTGQQLAQALRDRHIPVVGGPAGDAAFSELSVFVNLLRVIDNPSDVPLLSVLRYPHFGLDERDFARIRIAGGSGIAFSQAVLAYDREDETGNRLARFWEQIARFRRMAACMKLPDFLMRLRQEARFREYALTSPGGKGADEAIAAFIDASAATNPRCLADVLDMADRMRAGREAQPDPKTADGVYLTTIHRSKGLEFPVVILCGLHKVIDQRDAKGAVLVGRSLGIGLRDIDETTHIKRPTLHSVAVARGMKREKISETVRLLYVGMTRAIRRLVLLGAGSALQDKWLEDKTDSWQMSAHTYFDLLMPAVRMSCAEKGESLDEVVRILPCGDMSAAPESSASRLEELLGAAKTCEPAKVFERYVHSGDLGVPSKVSVSALKRLHEQTFTMSPQRPPSEDDGITAAERGTLMHRVLEVIGLGQKDAHEVDTQVKRLAAEGAIDVALAQHVDTAAIVRFLHSDLAARARASERCLFEQPFCLNMSARELELADSDESVIVQGVIDMCFIEDGQWVIVDYKTDRMDVGNAPEAAKKYAIQLQLYARALTDITGRPVAEKWIYYLSAGTAVEL
jgi:ATP-dependent helicase/nuclease subunit A